MNDPNNISGGAATSGYYLVPPQPQPCPTCGRCPTCGHYHMQPQYLFPYNPWVTYTGTAAGSSTSE